MKHMSHNPSEGAPTRRAFILGAAAVGTALAIGFRPDHARAQSDAPLNPLDVFLRIEADSTVTVLSAHMDMGQGCYHGPVSYTHLTLPTKRIV